MEIWRVHILIDRAGRGDETATDQLMRLALAGDPEARAAIVSSLDRGQSTCSDLVLDDELRELFRLANTMPKHAQPRVEAALRERGNSDCRRVQILGTLAQILKSQERYDEANEVLDHAEVVASGCPASVADLWRRRAVLRANQCLYEEGLDYIASALAYYESAADAGHDPYGNGVANCLFARANLKFHTGDKEGAAADFTACLAELGPKQAPELFSYAIANLAIVYSRMDRKRQEKAFSMFGTVRRRFRGHSSTSVPKALLDWCEGMLRIRLRKGKRQRALNRLLDAQMVFIHQEMRNQAVAVTTDIVRALGADTDRIKAFFCDTLTALRSVVDSLRLSVRIDTLESAARPECVDLERLDKAATSLRSAVEGPGVFPCLVV